MERVFATLDRFRIVLVAMSLVVVGVEHSGAQNAAAGTATLVLTSPKPMSAVARFGCR